jgi:hypothetical protein
LKEISVAESNSGLVAPRHFQNRGDSLPGILANGQVCSVIFELVARA